MTPDEEIDRIKCDAFEQFKNAHRIWMIEERGGQFVVHDWTGHSYINGAGVAPAHEYPALRKAAARLLQLLGTGPVAPQTHPEQVCIASITFDGARPEDSLAP